MTDHDQQTPAPDAHEPSLEVLTDFDQTNGLADGVDGEGVDGDDDDDGDDDLDPSEGEPTVVVSPVPNAVAVPVDDATTTPDGDIREEPDR